MTVGIAAITDGGSRLVLMSDKQLTGGPDETKSEEEPAKAGWIDETWLALFAGDPSFAELVISHASARMHQLREDGNPPDHIIAVTDLVRGAYKTVFDYSTNEDIFRPRLLDQALYRSGGYDETTREELRAAVEEYAENGTCELIVCGFDDENGKQTGQLMRIDLDTIERARSFATIGSGGPIARARLEWQKTTSSDPLPRVAYEVFEAKRHAEMNVYVGKEFDAFVMYGNGPSKLRTFSDDTKTILEEVFRYEDQTPFRKLRRSGKQQVVRRPRKGWEDILISHKFPSAAS